MANDSKDWLEILKQNDRIIELLKFIADDCAIAEIGDGNLNDVFRVVSKEDVNKSVIIKHAPPYIKCLGPGYPLSPNRVKYEYVALEWFNTLAPNSVPTPHFSEFKQHFMVMEDLRGYEVMKKQLVQGELNLDVARQIVQYAIVVHRKTTVKSLGLQKFQQLLQDFENTEMVSLTHDFIFTKPFIRDDPSNRCSAEVAEHLGLLYDNADLLKNAADLKTIFLEKKQCLLHGDLHTGSIMTRGQDAKMIDLEFAFVGPTGFDVGLLLANYLFSYHAHRLKGTNSFHGRVKQAVLETISLYLSDAKSQFPDDEFVTLVREILGFAGCELIRRIVGAAHVEDLEGNTPAEVECFKLGIHLVTCYNTVTIESVADIPRIFGLT